ncbi:hypothetical protein BH20VER3_BH20VER3_23100 [soil metagenome]
MFRRDPGRSALIKADLYSRPNAMNGKYAAAGLELDKLPNTKDTFFLETLKMKADLADRLITEADSQGTNTNDPAVMKKLGEKISAAGTPVHRSESIMAGVFVSLQLMVYYGTAAGIWGLVFKQSFLTFGLYGVIAGVVISLLAGPVVAFQRTKERVREISFGVGTTVGNLGIIIGVFGIVAWIEESGVGVASLHSTIGWVCEPQAECVERHASVEEKSDRIDLKC